jgi:hypothetical protein
LRVGGVTGSGFFPAALAEMCVLRPLGLTFCPGLTDSDLVPLRDLTGLEVLDLTGNPGLTDAGLYHLWGLTGLRWLSLARCDGVSDAAVARLRDGLRGCVIER